MCGEVNVYHIEKGLFVLLFCFRWLMEPFNEALEIFAGDGGFVGCGVDLPLHHIIKKKKEAGTIGNVGIGTINKIMQPNLYV